MSTTDSVSRTLVTPAARPAPVHLSSRVNEPLPPLNQVLSAHDVARLTRRHRWVLYALTALGRFPKQQKYRGHPIGWHRRDLASGLENKREFKARLHRRNQLRRLGRCRGPQTRLLKP
jgi:predicted DNA-binding transcriptional regulator AlpA